MNKSKEKNRASRPPLAVAQDAKTPRKPVCCFVFVILCVFAALVSRANERENRFSGFDTKRDPLTGSDK
jgi:hypothetical protein